MSLLGRVRRGLDPTRYRPRPGETRTAFLARMAEQGFPHVLYAEPLQPSVWELTREVVALRAELDTLRERTRALETALHGRAAAD